MSSTDGSSTSTFWKRRSSAASFSMYLRYSSSVVAPTQCSSPRASAGFSMLPASIDAFGLAGADHRVQLVDEQDDLAFLFRQIVEHALQAFFELAAELRARDERAHVEREDAFALQAFGHFAVDDALREPLDDGRLADARLADQHGVVLRAAREHLHRAADLVVAADDRIELARRRARGHVDRVFLERAALLLGLRIVHGFTAADLLDRLLDRRLRRAGFLQ